MPALVGIRRCPPEPDAAAVVAGGEFGAAVRLADQAGTAVGAMLGRQAGGDQRSADVGYRRGAASMTSRGGRQYDLEALVESPSCSSVYGLCE